MRTCLDEFELSFPINIWNRILYENVSEIEIDIYFCKGGYPRQIGDSFGSEAVNEFRLILVNEILLKNNTDDIWRVSSDAFAIFSKCSNCTGFSIDFRGINVDIAKKTLLIKVQ